MLTDSTTGKIGSNGSNKKDVPDALLADTGTHEAASINSDVEASLLRAETDVSGTQEAAVDAVNLSYQESGAVERKAEKMASDLEHVIQVASNAAKKSRDIINKTRHDDASTPTSEFAPGAREPLSDNNAAKEEFKEEVYRLVMKYNPQLRKFIDDLVNEKSKAKINKIVAETKSEIIAARVAVNKAQEEIKSSKEEAKKALVESEATQKVSELIVSQIKQDAITQSANEIAKAHEEVRAIRDAANAAVRRAEEEVKKSHEEVANITDYVKETLAVAQEKARKESEAFKACKAQAQAVVKQANEEARKAKEEAEEMRREAKVAIGKAALESKQSKADMELARRTVQEATLTAERKVYERFCEEIKKMREEVETTNKTARETIAKAQAESQQAKQELDTVKKAADREISKARREASEAKKEAEKARQSINETVTRVQEESRKAKEEAEKSILKASEVIIQAKKDIISMTKGEIVKARQELEAPGNVNIVASVEAALEKSGDQPLNSGHIANVLHEMRNPLHSISGFAKLMLEENIPDDQTRKEFLSIMVQQSESLHKLIDDISHTLNGKAEAFDVSKETIPPDKVIIEAIESAREMAQQKKNLIRYDPNPSLPEIEFDGFRIKQVIVNLLTNAIKFSPEGSPVSINAIGRNDELLVQVIDHGIGIPQADVPRIFDRHYQGKNRGNAEGSGLGLFICQQIIEAHGGRIWAKSVEGEGSIFSFSLPIAAMVRH
jgi:signal transduction histidine kinase